MHRFLLCVCLGLGLSFTPLAAAADSTSPGKASAFESDSFTNLTVGTTTLLTATLAKGKKKTVLLITGTLTTDSGASGGLHLLPTVNGFAVEGQTVDEVCAPSTVHCTVTGTWWFDVDASELANPGAVSGVPVEVDLNGGALAGSDEDISATATLSVQAIKK